MKEFRKTASRFRALVVAIGASVALSGCGVVNHMVYKTTGDVMKGFSRNHTVPYLLESDDLAMGCSMSEATTPLLMSFGRVTSEPDQLAVMLYLSSGSCAEEQAREHGLTASRAMYTMNASEAQDALIQQKRAHSLAAKRYLKGWQHHNAHYGDPDATECPKFKDEMDEFMYLAGLLSGLQALNAQIQSSSSIGVPFNTGSVVGRATQCLDNKKWWGAPMGLRATVWAMIPGTMPEGEDAFERLAIAGKQGADAGVRLGHVFHAIAAVNKNDEPLVKSIIRDHAESLKNDEPSEDWRFVDAMASNMLVGISDRLWVENTGSRTPVGQFGSFWDDARAPVETMDLDDLL
ncbi:hypothetical protein [Marinobacter halophilus]|uniref:Uncharacterized protein n=1 Tax=Marinobacter halophilus TaxID=1323740 RepID=A0A2T1KHY4_9GAMM|nr:hypothetical protein [Marinobacter halophilus]PSF09628.1 hypothetical protein C7H08_03870 [Marinobacter halophilus]GGC65469.1 hypothetical protein GCM10011362_12280 [Marinobacter halophilus]